MSGANANGLFSYMDEVVWVSPGHDVLLMGEGHWWPRRVVETQVTKMLLLRS